jgi:protein-tyrosine phosphatase
LNGYFDLHLHCIAGVDDGVPTVEEGLELCRGLYRLGFSKVVATPHIRTAMFDNRRPALQAAYEVLLDAAQGASDLPQIELAAEHFWDDLFWDLFSRGEALLFPGGKAILIEFPLEQIPLGIEQRFFRMIVRGIRPVLAHPERYYPLARTTQPIEPVLRAGARALLDVTALQGKYGRGPQRAAERMLEEGVYYAASTDAHSPRDIELTERSIKRLRELMGESALASLLSHNPAKILEGKAEDLD